MLHFNAGRTDAIKVAEEAMGFKADTAISLVNEPKSPNDRSLSTSVMSPSNGREACCG